MVVLLLTGCLQRPYPAYFDGDVQPAIDGVAFDPTTGFVGGGEAVITGTDLATTRTVVIGGRNARILDASATEVTIELPSHAPTRDPYDVALVTDDGVARLAEAVKYESPVGDFVNEERTSIALGTLSCPIEQWGLFEGDFDTIYFCGGELGFADAIAFGGASAQPGYATELLGYAPISTAPPLNQIAFWGPDDRRPPTIPSVGGPQAAGDAVVLERGRNFVRDFAIVEATLDKVFETYFWADAIEDWALVVELSDGETTFGVFDVFDITEDQLVTLEFPPEDATFARLGYRFTEFYEDSGEFETVAFFGGTAVDINGDVLTADASSLELIYDEFTGFWFPESEVGSIDVSRGQYEVSTERLGERTTRGTVRGAPMMSGLFPDLLSGEEFIVTDEPFSFYWDPIEDDEDAVVVLELKVFDMDIDNPNGNTELYRITATAPDWFGYVAIPPSVLSQLPARVENHFDQNYDFTGLWGEATLSRHALRKLPGDEGDIVVDFVHTTQAHVAFVR